MIKDLLYNYITFDTCMGEIPFAPGNDVQCTSSQSLVSDNNQLIDKIHSLPLQYQVQHDWWPVDSSPAVQQEAIILIPYHAIHMIIILKLVRLATSQAMSLLENCAQPCNLLVRWL